MPSSPMDRNFTRKRRTTDRRSSQIKAGTYLPKKREELRQEGRFADVSSSARGALVEAN